MDKIEEFLSQLDDELRFLKPKEASSIIKYYRDRINIATDYGEKPEHVLATLPSPKKIAEDTYNAKGADYLIKRKKQIRKGQIFKAIGAGFLLLIILVGILTIFAFFGKTLINLFKLAFQSFKMGSLIDTLGTFLFTISYILLLVIALIYIFDLLYIIATHFILNILDTITKEEKEYKFANFTISNSIEKVTKKKKILLKTLITLVSLMVILGVTSYATKGYIYRSMNDQVEISEHLQIRKNITKIEIEPSEAFVRFKTSDQIDNIAINYGFEFNNDLVYEINNETLKISSIAITKYGLLGLLYEPLPVIEIVIPSSMNLNDLDITLVNGTLDIVDLNSVTNVVLKGSNSVVAITNSNIEVLRVDANKFNLNLENTAIKDTDVKLQNGRYCAVGKTHEKFKIENYNGTLIFQDVVINDADIMTRASKNAFEKVTIGNLLYKDYNAESYFRDAVITKADMFAAGTSKIDLERVRITEETILETNLGTFNLSYLKTPKIKATLDQGVINLVNFNQNYTNTNLDDTYLTEYNAYSITNSSLDVTSNKGSVALVNSIFNESKMTLTNGGLFQITSSTINDSQFDISDGNLSISDLNGNKIYIKATSGNVIFYNNNIESNILLKLEKTNKANVDIGSNIKQVTES